MRNKWMTREEFEKSKKEGLCWIASNYADVYHAIYHKKNYYISNGLAGCIDPREIKAVMPIKKPEYPKEVK